jgi:hypothetical protein
MSDSSGLESLYVRLYFDRHIMTRLAIDLRDRGYEVLSTEEAGATTPQTKNRWGSPQAKAAQC